MSCISQIMRQVTSLAITCVLITVPVICRPVVVTSSFESLDGLVFIYPPSFYFQSSFYPEESRFQERGYYNIGDVKVHTRRQAVMNKTRLWPGGIVPYVLDASYKQEVRDIIEVSMREIEQNVGSDSNHCVKFIPRTTEVNYLDVRSGNSCSSVIGLDYTGPQVSTFSADCAIKGILLHELLHTLGLYHEQDRYDRDSFVTINNTNMREEAIRDFILKNSSNIDTLGTPYDFTSIMHYGPYAFPKDQRWPVMTPKPEFSKGVWMGQRNALSPLDVLRVQRLYHCQEDTSHIVSDISDDNRLAWCDFEDGPCNFSVSVSSPNAEAPTVSGSVQNGESLAEQAGKLLWIITSNATPDGPQAGSTNGLDAFFYASNKYCEQVSVDVKNQTEASDPFSNSNKVADISGSSTDSIENTDKSTEDSADFDSTSSSIEGVNNSDKSSDINANFQSSNATAEIDSVTETTADNNKPTETAANSVEATENLPQTPASTQLPSRVTVTLTSPTISTDADAICLDYHINQAGPSSYLEIYIKGPLLTRLKLLSLQGAHRNHWATVRQSLRLPANVTFQLEFVAVLDDGPVALDDVHIINGICK